LEALLLFVISRPTLQSTKVAPCYDAWESPVIRQGPRWDFAQQVVESVLQSPGEHPSQMLVDINGLSASWGIRNDPRVRFYVSNDEEISFPEDVYIAYVDEFGSRGNRRYQYYSIIYGLLSYK
jgi:hypothetical protein